ncbi:SMI1/KNR4 family protein [Mesobacillus maritimus]|uniref:SMI1/KNR4 family protein n=1 Tax=Mesobacillus maritimus TaxID=1643336 RepID=UPI00203BAE44|nr:SMI1/KNR4 family protein [Mesobacillus maritimus]MCM3669029.1 SMI1/KNR4 family protein [Mesobacillus maritimus]
MTIWDPSKKDSDIVLEPLTDDDVNLAENTYQFTFPIEYINLLKEQNGGFLRTDAIPVNFPSYYAEGYVQFDHLFGIKRDQGIMESSHLLSEWGISDKRFIAISGVGHEWLVLDYRDSPINPQITHISVYEGEPILNTVAQSFSKLLTITTSLGVEKSELETDPAYYKDEISVVNAKRLIQSGDLNSIVRGAGYWISTAEKIDELIDILLEFIKKTSDDTMIYEVSELIRSAQIYADKDEQRKILETYKAYNNNGLLDFEIEDLEKILYS